MLGSHTSPAPRTKLVAQGHRVAQVLWCVWNGQPNLSHFRWQTTVAFVCVWLPSWGQVQTQSQRSAHRAPGMGLRLSRLDNTGKQRHLLFFGKHFQNFRWWCVLLGYSLTNLLQHLDFAEELMAGSWDMRSMPQKRSCAIRKTQGLPKKQIHEGSSMIAPKARWFACCRSSCSKTPRAILPVAAFLAIQVVCFAYTFKWIMSARVPRKEPSIVWSQTVHWTSVQNIADYAQCARNALHTFSAHYAFPILLPTAMRCSSLAALPEETSAGNSANTRCHELPWIRHHLDPSWKWSVLMYVEPALFGVFLFKNATSLYQAQAA